MQYEIKAFNRRKPRPSTDELVAKLTMTAATDYDGKVLAAISSALVFGKFPYLKDAILQAVGELTK